MPSKMIQRELQLEHDCGRDAREGYEPDGRYGFIRYLEHGFPSPLVRWHFHDEYELHLICASSGRVFVGDYIGPFSPGHLVLTSPRMPHNWVSLDTPPEGVKLRDMVLQFSHAPLETMAAAIPEVRDILPLLARATYGVEFFDMSEQVKQRFIRIRDSSDLPRFVEFLSLLGELAQCSNYRLLSTVAVQSFDDDHGDNVQARINTAVEFIAHNFTSQFSIAELARQLDMSERVFARFFRNATGNTVTDFVNRLRINQACQLLMDTDHYVTNICYDVGFNNVANFNRRFLELKGMTPKEFRRLAGRRHGD